MYPLGIFVINDFNCSRVILESAFDSSQISTRYTSILSGLTAVMVKTIIQLNMHIDTI